jgi:hypothetical protein
MTAPEMIKLRMQDPFQPFEIHLKNGASIRVEHSYSFATRPESKTCTVYEGDRLHFVSYPDIEEVVMMSVNGS